jgi:ABC-type cobalamin/Fe3+-siderophores transport system ATPase subunit
MSELNRKETGMKIISAELQNFQSLEHKVVDIQGKSIVVVGKNGGSKSTILRAIQSPINSVVVPAKAIKEGEESAHVKLIIKGDLDGEEKTFKYVMNFSPSNQKGSVVVVDEEGNKIKSKSMQRDIIGDVSFDVDEFIRLGVTSSGKISQSGLKEQIEVLRQFLTDEEKQNLENLDQEYKEKFDKRADVNKTVKILKANLSDATDITEEEVVKYKEDKSKELEEVNDKLMNMADAIVEFSERKRSYLNSKEWLEKYSNSPKWLSLTEDYIKTLKEVSHPEDSHIRHLEEYIELMSNSKDMVDIENANIADLKDWFKENKEPKQDELKAKQVELKEYNDKYNKIKDVVTKHAEITKQEKDSNKLTKRLKAIQEEKKKSFETSKLPVKGLSFDEEGVYFEGLPFNGDHHPSSVIIRVGVQLAIAMNPNLKCIFIKDGSLFDKETFSRVLKFVEMKGYQLFIEMVDWNATNDAEVKFAEQFINN